MIRMRRGSLVIWGVLLLQACVTHAPKQKETPGPVTVIK
jgi:hypothetical protein